MEVSLKDICYEQIKDQYWYGLFGDFKLVIDKTTGYFNATKLCQDTGKRFSNWLQNKESQELVEYYGKGHELFKTIQGDNTIISGTYVPEQFILCLALWISPEFYAKASAIVTSYGLCEVQEKYGNNEHLLQKQLHQKEQVRLQNERQQNQRHQSFEEVKTVNVKKLHTFALIQKNCASNFPLHVVRTQRGSFHTVMKYLYQKYPQMKVIMQFGYNPRCINLFHLIRQRIGNIQIRYNEIKLLNGYTEAQFVRDIQSIANTFINMRE